MMQCPMHGGGDQFELWLDSENYQGIVFDPWGKESKFQSLTGSCPQVKQTRPSQTRLDRTPDQTDRTGPDAGPDTNQDPNRYIRPRVPSGLYLYRV